MDDPETSFEKNLNQCFSPDDKIDTTTLNKGGSRDERLDHAVIAALDDLENLDAEFAAAFERFAFTHDELELERCE